jgi:hypothetical protein
LSASAASLDRLPEKALVAPAGPTSVIVRALRGRGEEWALLAGARRRVFVNGLVLKSGLCMLGDRDEIRFDRPGPPGGHPISSFVFFSTERIARIQAFSKAERALFCPRCKKEIEPGGPAVQCPSCGVWHHENSGEGRNCWTYADRCAVCSQSTDSTEFSFIPDDCMECS